MYADPERQRAANRDSKRRKRHREALARELEGEWPLAQCWWCLRWFAPQGIANHERSHSRHAEQRVRRGVG